MFTINSAKGKVVGLKELTNGPSDCYNSSSDFTFTAQASYQALIYTGRSISADYGTATTYIFDTSSLFKFSEAFVSSQS